jgi:hypothetical protein
VRDDWLWRHDPTRGDEVVQVADVITMKMCEKNCRKKGREHPSTREAHYATAPAVHQDVPTRGLYEGGRAGAICVGDRASGAKQRYFHALDGRC